MANGGRDRLRELLDAVLDGVDGGASRGLDAMADAAASSPFHFVRTLTAQAGEPPVRMRRRILLERAAWQLRQGRSVTEAAFDAGYESVEGFGRAFARAFGHPPSAAAGHHAIPAPNGIHFHPPTSLWITRQEQPMNPLTELLVVHDVDDTRELLEIAGRLSDEQYRAVRMPDTQLLTWHGPEESVAAVLENHVWTKEVWTAAIEGSDVPERDEHADAAALMARHETVAPRWLALVRDIERRGAWDDLMIDALCDPPESFVLGAVIAHVLTYSAFRRQVVRVLIRTGGTEISDGDPIDWLRSQDGGS